MPQRDMQTNVEMFLLDQITVSGTGDTDGTVTLDTDRVRCATFAIRNQTALDASDRITFIALESDEPAANFTAVADEKYIPDGADRPRLDETATGALGTSLQRFGVFSTKRYLRVRLNASAFTGPTEVFDVLAVTDVYDKPPEGVATDGLA